MKKSVLTIPDFRLLFATRILAYMSLQAQAVIVGWLVYQLTKDPLLLGLLGLTEAIPAIGCSFFSGHIVDTHRPALIYRLSFLSLFLNSLVLLIAALPEVGLEPQTRLTIIFAGVFISGAARSFTSPSVFSLIPRVVPRSDLASAAAWSSSSYQFAAIIGPALGGLVYGTFGVTWAFTVPVVLIALALFLSGALSRETKAIRSHEEHEPFLQSVQTGIRFSLGHRVLLSAMLLDMFSVLFGGAVAVLPIFSDQVLHAGSFGLGLLRAAPSVGSACVALVLAVRPLKVISGKMLLWAVAGFGVSTVLFALSTNALMAFVFLMASGAFDGVSMVIRTTILQLLTPERMRGRVSALSSVFITSSNEIGAFESGLAARFMGLIPSLVFGGTMTLLVVSGTAWLAPELRKTRIRDGDHQPV